MVWKPMSLQNSCAKILMPDVMLLECGVLGRHWGNNERAKGKGSSAPIKGAPHRLFAPSTTSHLLNWPKKFPLGNANAGKAEVQIQDPLSMPGEQSQVQPYWNIPVLLGTLGHCIHSSQGDRKRMFTEVCSVATGRRQSGCLSSSR